MKNRCNFHLRKDEITAVFIFELCRQTWYSLYMHLRDTVRCRQDLCAKVFADPNRMKSANNGEKHFLRQ